MKDFGRPGVELVQQTDETFTLSLNIASELPCLQGHFPNLPVVPGVAQLHWALEFAASYLGVSNEVSALEVLKYQHVMQPDRRIQLSLRFDEQKSKLYFNYFDEDNKYSSGRVVLGAVDV